MRIAARLIFSILLSFYLIFDCVVANTLDGECECSALDLSDLQTYLATYDVVFYGQVEDIIYISGHEYMAKFNAHDIFKIFNVSNVTLDSSIIDDLNKIDMHNLDIANKTLDYNAIFSDILPSARTFLEKTPYGNNYNVYIYYNTIPDNCYATFSIGERYLVYATYNNTINFLTVNACSPSLSTSFINADLMKLRMGRITPRGQYDPQLLLLQNANNKN